MTLFRRLVRDLIEAKVRDRKGPFERVVEHIRLSPEPARCINILLEECATNSGEDGLRLGADVLSESGKVVLMVAEQFAVADSRVRDRRSANPANRLSVHEDVWHVLLHGIARAEAPVLTRMNAIVNALWHPSFRVRVEAVEALGELWANTPRAVQPAIRALIEAVATKHEQERICRAAVAVLTDLEE
jgi:hypothetical protein